MNWFFLLLTLFIAPKFGMTDLYSFSNETNLKEWRIVNDGVMGGISNSTFILTNDGNGLFSGHVSLANNGGFASIQLNKTFKLSEDMKYIVLRVKGDGKQYEFRIKNNIYQSVSYVHQFKTTGEWQNIQLAINEFYPQYFGQKLNRSNFNYKNIEQISFLISNKQEEDFKLLIGRISIN